MKSFNVIPFVLIVLLLVCIYLINRENNEQLTEFCKIAYQQGIKDGKQDQIEDNIKKGVMTDDGKWKDGFELAR